MKKILNIVCAVLAVLLLCGAIGGVVYLFSGTDDPAIDEPTVDELSVDNPTDDYTAVEQVILNEEGIIF